MAGVRLWVDIDRGEGLVETRGLTATNTAEAEEFLRLWAKEGPILRIVNDFGEDRTDQYNHS